MPEMSPFAPVHMIGFTPPGACRAELRCSWPEGTAERYRLTGELISAARDLKDRKWELEQFVRFECGTFACDTADEVDAIAEIVKREFPALVPDWRYRDGKSCV
jgi:hypothetical protein